MQRYLKQPERGITLLITLLFMSVLLGITATLLNVSLKQYKIAGIGFASEAAFQAAQAGLECALFHDYNVFTQNLDNDLNTGDGGNESTVFQVPGGNGTVEQPGVQTINCMDDSAQNANGAAASGDKQLFEFDWGISPDNERCTSISVYKFKNDTDFADMDGAGVTNRDCPQGGECTVIKSRGYNVSCIERTGPRVVERELTQIY